tara:strand:+ start:159 stop:521 length:363 start_codon:yes stop_codon:yes gene_type:complete
MNQVNIIGNIGRIERKGAVLKFSVATNRVSKGEKVTDWHNMVAFGDTAERLEKFFDKGDTIAITGRLQYGSYDKDGVTRYTTDIVVDRWYFTGKKSDSSKMDTFISNKLTAKRDDEEIPF